MIRGAHHLVWIFLCVLVGCGPSLPSAYVRARDQAENAYTARQYEKAAKYWLEAANATPRRRDQLEARFRAAASFERAGRFDQARRLYAEIERERQPNDRASRASFALAELEIRHGDPERGYQALQAAARKHPNHGIARGAMLRYLEWLKNKSGSEALLAYIDRAAPTVRESDLEQTLLYVRARLFQEQGKHSEARDAFQQLADRFPYPRGAYWDDALFEAAKCEEELGNYTAAVNTLYRLLAEREEAHMTGSYERVRYAQAHYRIAELYRDKLSDPLRARRAFREVFNAYPTSLLRDDALWQEALIARRARDSVGTCAPLRLLVEQQAESRYAACAHELCHDLKPLPGRSCRDYIRREAAEQP